MEIIISKLRMEDREAWEKLYCSYAKFYQVPMNLTIINQVWSWIFDHDQKFYALIAKNKEKILGIMHYRAMLSPLRGQTIGFLDDLFVEPEYRGTGVVQALFKGLKQSAKDHNWSMIRWITAENNYRGRAVYDKLAERTQWLTYQMNLIK